MKKHKILAIVFALLTFVALQETHRVFTSSAPDIVASRATLKPIMLLWTGIFVFLTIHFWKKYRRHNDFHA